MRKCTRVAIYLRLSRDDGGVHESNSISSKRALLVEAATKQQFARIEEFIDDGFSGTTFERPGFILMLRAVGEGRIDTILVKDMSRLGRDYLTVGHNVERYFPENGVRFISVNDGYDSETPEDYFLPIKKYHE